MSYGYNQLKGMIGKPAINNAIVRLRINNDGLEAVDACFKMPKGYDVAMHDAS